jgi:hypothetical protein
MKLSAPQKGTWWVCVVLGVLGLIGTIVSIPVVSGFAFWLVFIGLLLLVLATLLPGF